jgi:hypothetical protein
MYTFYAAAVAAAVVADFAAVESIKTSATALEHSCKISQLSK